ncbi:uncharacterized protein LOC135200099 isoform X2 [Macrobrachium nipponense]|uniref:uncharacterized protein LOC135200099 isoform X2 n=1 Tax=Macrobrachium nipponense TaxID=159736 RepID=UPI0030C8CFA9
MINRRTIIFSQTMEIPTVSRKFACETCMTLHGTEQEAFSCCESREEETVEVSLHDNAEVSPNQEGLHPSLETYMSPGAYGANIKKTKWSRELFSLFLDEVELRYPSLRDRAAKKINIWKEICSALNIHNSELTYDQVHQKWRNIVAAVRKYEESCQLGERGRKVRPLFYERIKIILGEAVPNSLQHDLSPRVLHTDQGLSSGAHRRLSKEPSRASQGMKRKLQTQKIASVLETLAQVWNSDGCQDYEGKVDGDSDIENGDSKPVKRALHDSGTAGGSNVKLYDIPGKSKAPSGNPNAGVYVYDFKSEWHNTLPFIKRGPTVHQFWCDICRVLDFCDYQGNDGIRWHVQSLAHQEKAKELQKVPKPTSKPSTPAKSTVPMETKVVDIKKLEKMVFAKPEIVDRAIIISVEVKTLPRNDVEMVKDILSVVGERNVEEIDVVTKTLILLTLREGCETLLDSVRMIKFYDIFDLTEIHYTLNFLHPIESNIEGMLTGLPRLISSSELPCIEEHIGKYLSYLSGIKMEYVPWPDTSLMSGNLRVTASVKDLVTSYVDLKKTSYIYMADFMGKLNFENFEIVNGCSAGNLPAEERSGVSIHRW